MIVAPKSLIFFFFFLLFNHFRYSKVVDSLLNGTLGPEASFFRRTANNVKFLCLPTPSSLFLSYQSSVRRLNTLDHFPPRCLPACTWMAVSTHCYRRCHRRAAFHPRIRVHSNESLFLRGWSRGSRGIASILTHSICGSRDTGTSLAAVTATGNIPITRTRSQRCLAVRRRRVGRPNKR